MIVKRFCVIAGLVGAMVLFAACSEAPREETNQTYGDTIQNQSTEVVEELVEKPDTLIQPAIVIQPSESMNLSKYSEFNFESALSVGLDPEIATKADAVLANLSEPWVAEAAAENETQECLEGEAKCGFFELTLERLNCEANLLCVKNYVAKVGIGMATGSSSVKAVRIDSETGRDVSLSEFLGNEQTSNFIDALNETTELVQRANDSYFEDSPPNYSSESMPAWLPLLDGIHVWFPRYEVGPGYLGIVEVRLRSSGGGWNSWLIGESGEIAILSASNGDQSKSRKAGVTDADKFTLSRILSDIDWELDSNSCRNVELSNRNANWGILDQARDAPDNPVGCFLADSYAYVGKIEGRWRILDRSGSSVDSCSSLQEGLSGEGVPRNSIADFIEAKGCVPDEDPADDAAQGDWANESVVEQPRQPELNLVTVPQIVGMFNKDAERAMNSAGLQAMIMPQIGDPSIAAQTTNGCVVISQSPSAGAQVERGSRISAKMQCPNTGYQAPAPPQPYFG